MSLAALLLLAAPASVGGGQALPAMLALFGLLGAPWRRPNIGAPPPWLLAGALLLGWLGLSSLWSPQLSTQAVRLLLTLAAGALCVAAARALDERQRHRLYRTALLAWALLAGLLLVEALLGDPLNRAAQPDVVDWALNKNPSKGAAILLCLTAPLLAPLLGAGPRRTGLAAAMALATFWLCRQFGSTSNELAFVAGFALFAAGLAAPRAAIIASGAIAAAWTLAAPWALRGLPIDDGALPYSWAARAHVWRFAADRIAEKPWFGWGFDSARTFDAVITVQGHPHPAIPLHPHNVFVQVWLEAGAVGAILLALTLALAAYAGARADPPRRLVAGALGAAGAIFAIDNLSFGAWQEWWIAAAFLAAIAVMLARPAPAPTR